MNHYYAKMLLQFSICQNATDGECFLLDLAHLAAEQHKGSLSKAPRQVKKHSPSVAF
jgi:hypothetical protein